MSENPESQTAEITSLVFPPEILSGTYANQIQHLSTDIETVLDFFRVVPSAYSTDDSGSLVSVEARNELVARIILPREQFMRFMRTFASRLEDFEREDAAVREDTN